MGRISRLGNSLYTGKRSIDFVGRKWLWYAISGVIVILAVVALSVKGLNYGIEFTGGTQYKVSNLAESEVNQDTADEVRTAVGELGIQNAEQPVVTTSGNSSIIVQTEELTNEESDEVTAVLIETLDASPDDISQDQIGASWGDEVRDRAILGLVVFLILVVLFIWAYFREWKMSLAAIVALAHDVIITVGVYSLSGFEVSPATVTGLLTILGFSLYDTVVVFDKIRENTKDLRGSRTTYAKAANLAVNQTLVRSINTSIVALLPVGALLYAGVFMIGSGALKDLSLSLFVGMAAGAYSSIFIATPLLVQLKEMEPGVKAGDARARKHKSRRTVDPFANVPVYTEDMPVQDDPGDEPEIDDDDRRTPEANRSVPPGAPGRVTAGERPPSARPVSGSTAAGRPQPTRKPRSQRGKG
jgi:preprotein translocase subunit SecF